MFRVRSAGLVGALAVSLALLGAPVFSSSLTPGAQATTGSESTRRQGVIALASAISAVGQTPELSTPLPFTTTSLADVLDLDQKLTSNLDAALSGQDDLAAGLSAVEGIGNIQTSQNGNRISFTYGRTVRHYALPLVHDDGDLRFGANSGAGSLDVSLTTDPAHPFVVQVDPSQSDPLLKVALVSQPQLNLSVDIDTPASPGIAAFTARQGFTDIRVTGGHYQIHRTQNITMRDPDGRSLLTLEDLRYSTLPDLFRVTMGTNGIDIGLNVALPSSVSGGTGRTGTLSVNASTAPDKVWPAAADATRTYGAALTQATGLTMVDGLTGLAQYTGTALALQDAANVDFPNLGGGTSDLFSPGDRLLDLLSSAATAQVQCGAAPQFPPAGVAVPGDTVYCTAKTPDGLGTLSGVTWSIASGAGHIVGSTAGALGPNPGGLVRIDGSDGEPDVQVSFVAKSQRMVARSMPHTVQDVMSRIGELAGSTAQASLSDGRLDVAVDIEQASHSEQLPLGNPDGLGALVGLTGLKSPDPDNPAEVTATATGASFKAGFGIQTGTPAAGASRQTYLLPASSGDILRIQGLSATAPALAGMAARIGFLEVNADLADLSLGQASGNDAVALTSKTGAAPISFAALLSQDGALDPDAVALADKVTAGIGFSARELAISGSTYASGVSGGASGTASVHWAPDGLPQVSFGTGYDKLRVFDPAPAAFLSGSAHVIAGNGGAADKVQLDVTNLPSGKTLYGVLGVAAPDSGQPDPEVARRMLAGGPACQSVTVLDDDTLTCTGLAPRGVAAFGEGDHVEAIVLGDPFALRDSVIEGLSTALASFGRIDNDNISGDGLTDDQYSSTLPLVDLRPAQLAVERDGLTTGLAKINKAATEDEAGDNRSSSLPSVSSAQELGSAIGSLMGTYPAGLNYDLSGGTLGISLSASTPSGKTLEAPLRLMVDNPGQVVTDRSYPVDISSSTTLDIDVDVANARPVMAGGTGTSSTATLALPSDINIAGKMQAGVGQAAVAASSGSTARLGVSVDTEFDATQGVFTTTRSNALAGKGAADPAALASLISDQGTIDYSAKATDSSGGAGAAQPERQPMQVEYLAEGLDGLATALGQATDGAAPRNIGPGGAPISAPLIGTNLDAGAGVSGIVTGLTSHLRDQLGGIDTTDLVATDLQGDLETAMKTAIDDTRGLENADVSTIAASVICGSPDGSCDPAPCVDPTPDDPAPAPCETDTSTGWDTVTVSALLQGSEKTGQSAFETGMAGLQLTSDKKVDTTTSWSLPITLRLKRNVGPQIVINPGDALTMDVQASLPDAGLDAIIGYLPGRLKATGDGSDDVHTTVDLSLLSDTASDPKTYDLFDLYDGKLAATPSFSDPDGTDDSGAWKDGLSLDFETDPDNAAIHVRGTILMPWTTDGFEELSYNNVELNVGDVVSTMATPFKVIDPYLAPIRDVINVLRTPIPVVSDLSQLAGGDEVSLLSILEHLSADRPKLDLAYRVIGLVDGVTKLNGALSTFGDEWVNLQDASNAAAVLKVEPREVEVYSKCTETVATTTTVNNVSTTKKTAPAPCPDEDSLEEEQAKPGVAGQTTGEKRTGKRNVKKSVAQTTKSVTGNVPGFSLPFLEDPNQILDVLTGAGEATYFRVDFGTLAASVAYTKKFGPIMAGPVPIVPFVGGSISVEGRLAMGFDSYAQTLAFQSLSHPGAVKELRDAYAAFDDGDIIKEGFYLDDLDSDGEDVPEVKLVTTLEAGASVSIGIVSAGLKGSITLTINVDLNDPNDDGKLRTAEIKDSFGGNPICAFDVNAEIEASITVFVEIELLIETLEYEFDLLRLGPYELFRYGCPDQVPTLVKHADGNQLALTSGSRTGDRHAGSSTDGVDDYEVRQFDSDGGAVAGHDDSSTTYEVSALGRVQRVEVKPDSGGYKVTVFSAAVELSTDVAETFTTTELPVFVADGGNADDKLQFLTGENFDDAGALLTTPFSTRVASLTGGPGKDALTTGAGDDNVAGDAGDDSIDSGAGNDVVDGGTENDVISGGAGNDDLAGDAGDDHIDGAAGADREVGGLGNDSLQGGPGRDVRAVLIAPEGTSQTDEHDTPQEVTDQVLAGFDSGDVLVGGAGADTVDGGDGSDVVVGGDASDLATNGFGSLFRNDGDRVVNVIVRKGDGMVHKKHVAVPMAKTPDAAALDTLCASGAALSGVGNRDFVTGGPEADVVIGGDGPDSLDGGSGPDEICGRAAADQMSGDGAQIDDATGSAASNDVIRGGTGDDQADGGPGDDVMYGDDVTLFRSGSRHLDGSLGASGGGGSGRDYLQGGDGDDVLAGEGGSDLLIGEAGNDQAFGEGSDTPETGGAAPDVADRLLACNPTTRVINGKIDLNGDLLAGAGSTDVVADSGQLAGLRVVDGVVRGIGTSTALDGLLGGDVVLIGGLVDLDHNGSAGAGDTGTIPFASMLDTTGSNTAGDCILAGDGNDELTGGQGSDYLGSGAGTDLASGGDGNDLILGDDGTDVLLGGPHSDVLVGGLGGDRLQGGNGDDRLRGNEGADDLIGGSASSGADDGQDVLLGGRDEDVLVAENGSIYSPAINTAVGDSSVPWRGEGDVPSDVTATAAPFSNSALGCAQAVPTRWLTLLKGDGTAGTGVSSPGVDDADAYDELYGGFGCDFVFGSEGKDVVRGGQDSDMVEGGPAADYVYGDDGDDVVIGGSSYDPGKDTQYTVTRSGGDQAKDGGDVVHGDRGADTVDGSDLVMGDNALPTRLAAPDGQPGPDYTVKVLDVVTTGSAPAGTSGGDTIDTGGSDDRVFGQGGDDTVNAGDGNDYVEGDEGQDTLNGQVGNDDLVGGSSANDGLPLGTTATRLQQVLTAAPFETTSAGVQDTADVIDGGTGDDVLLGDNGRITRPANRARDIGLAQETTAGTSAADTLTGGDQNDRLFGQEGDDLLRAGQGDDYAEGNAGSDTMYGDSGADTVIGGSSLSPASDGALGALAPVNITDSGDWLYGDDDGTTVVGNDLILGDNATVLPGSSGQVVQLAQVPNGAAAPAGTSGGDRITGGGAATGAGAGDQVFGQGGNDVISTGAAADYIEGSDGQDDVSAGDGNDTVIGGSSASNGQPLGAAGSRLRERMAPLVDTSAAGVYDDLDKLRAGGGNDAVLGDNGRVTRPATGHSPDVAMADVRGASDLTYGSDLLYGDAGDDDLYGQLDDGTSLGTGDRLEGGDGRDSIVGDLAVVDRMSVAELAEKARTIAINSEAIVEKIYPAGVDVPTALVPTGQAQTGGPDVALGGTGDDVVRMGGGRDIANGNAGSDLVLGGDGDDTLWGGLDHDRIFGGYGDDDLDLKKRSGDPAVLDGLREAADADGTETTSNGPDFIYGGWGADELQVDVGGAGKADTASDHVVDWVGAHNVYYVCGGAYGAGRVIRQQSPSMTDLLNQLVLAAGDRDVATSGSGGFYDLGIVPSSGISANTATSPEAPGHFTCG